MEKIKNKLLYRSANAMLDKMVTAHIRWQRGVGNLQFQIQDPETQREFFSAIDHMRTFVNNIS